MEDLDAKGHPRTESRGRGDDASTSLLIRISSKDPNKPIIKKHHSLSLRAPTPAEKNEWLQRLRKASGVGTVATCACGGRDGCDACLGTSYNPHRTASPSTRCASWQRCWPPGEGR